MPAQPFGRRRDAIHAPKERITLGILDGMESRRVLRRRDTTVKREPRSGITATIRHGKEPEPAFRRSFRRHALVLHVPIDVIRIATAIRHLRLGVIIITLARDLD